MRDAFLKTAPLTTIGCAVFPLPMIPAVERLKFHWDRQFSIIEHLSLAQLIRDKHFEKQIRKNRLIYEAEREAIRELFFFLLKNKVEIRKQSAGLHLSILLSNEFEETQIQEAISRSSLPLVSTARYYLKGFSQRREYLLYYAGIEEQTLKNQIHSFANFLLNTL